MTDFTVLASTVADRVTQLLPGQMVSAYWHWLVLFSEKPKLTTHVTTAYTIKTCCLTKGGDAQRASHAAHSQPGVLAA